MAKADKRWSDKPLLSVEETAIVLGQSRSSIYRAIERGDLPLPVFTINGRLRIARRSVDRLLDGDLPLSTGNEGVVKGGAAGEHSEHTLDDPVPSADASHHGNGRAPAPGLCSPACLSRATVRRAPRRDDPPSPHRRCSGGPCAPSPNPTGPASAPR
jgi:predicted DNA-binding transcriptional regulator AlpA